MHMKGPSIVQRWEYAIMSLRKAPDSDDFIASLQFTHSTAEQSPSLSGKDLLIVLGILGDHGWELVSTDNALSHGGSWVFKRPLGEGTVPTATTIDEIMPLAEE